MADHPSGEDDKVGYCHPPKHAQFKKGVSGNPKGRPRKPPRPVGETEVDRVLNGICGTVEVAGTTRRIDGNEARFRALIKSVMKSPRRIVELQSLEQGLIERVLAARASEGRSDKIQFVLPAIMSIDDWEALAVPMQRKLLAEVRL